MLGWRLTRAKKLNYALQFITGHFNNPHSTTSITNAEHIVHKTGTHWDEGHIGEKTSVLHHQLYIFIYLLTPLLKEPLVRVAVGPSTNRTLQNVQAKATPLTTHAPQVHGLVTLFTCVNRTWITFCRNLERIL